MKRYIVTEKQIRKLKDKLEESYLKIEKEWLREWLEDIEVQEMTFASALDGLACRLARHVNRWRQDKNTYSFMKGFEAIDVATLFLPRLVRVDWHKVWDEAAKEGEERAGGTYDVFMKALEGEK